jgi:ABC-type multidrug transport system fused ATPase/permease subunit
MNELKKMFSYTHGYRFQFIFGVVLKGINALVTSYFMAVLLQTVTQALTMKTSSAVIKAVINTSPLFFLCLILQLFSVYIVGKAGSYAAMQMRKDIVSRILASDVGSISGKNSCDIIATFTSDIPTAFQNMTDIVSIPVNAIFLGLGGLIYILLIDTRLALLTFGIGIFIFIYSIFFAKWMRKISDKVLKGRAISVKYIKELLDGHITIHMFDMSAIILNRYRQVVNDVKKNSILYGTMSGLLGGVNNGVSYFFGKVLIFLAGLIVFSGKFDVPTMLGISQMAGGVTGIFFVSRILTDTQTALNGAKRAFGFMNDIKPERAKSTTGIYIEPNLGTPFITFDDVSFGYIGNVNILSHVSFGLDRNSASIFIGESGSGKTTILRLLEALYIPTSGKICLDGKDIRLWDLHELRIKMAYVPQDPLLFEGTIKYNICIGSDHWNNDRAIHAAEQAGAHSFIESFPYKYDTQVSEGGLSLSGGERQRIALARAFYRDAPVLLLDEATSAVDAKNESIIYECLKQYKKNHVVLFSTHKESALTIADNIYKVDSGKLLKIL